MNNKPLRLMALLGICIVLLGATLACSLATRLSGGQPAGAPAAGGPAASEQAAGGTAAGETATPTARPIAERLIVYAGMDGNIYTIDHQGGKKKAITDDAHLSSETGESGRIYEYPTWAPDGDHLAFVELSSSGTTNLHARLLSASAASGEVIETFSSDEYQPFYLYWSPDSKNISFLSNGSAGQGLLLHLAAADGSGSQIAGTGQPYYWDWSPEENEIFIHTGGAEAENAAARLAYITMDDPFPAQEIDLQPASFQAPAWSPDGETIAMAAVTKTGEAIVLQDRQSGKQQTIAAIEGPVAFAWSPDGSQLAYTISASNEPGSVDKELYVVQPAHPEGKKLLGKGILVSFFWSPDSQRIAIITPSLSEPGAFSGGLEKTISLQASTQQQHPDITLGLQAIDVGTGETKRLTSFTPTQAFLSVLPFYDQYQRSMTLWSPDSREMVISALDTQQQPGIYVVNAVDGGGKRIADGDLAFWSP